jgi:hypothetical protein
MSRDCGALGGGGGRDDDDDDGGGGGEDDVSSCLSKMGWYSPSGRAGVCNTADRDVLSLKEVNDDDDVAKREANESCNPASDSGAMLVASGRRSRP